MLEQCIFQSNNDIHMTQKVSSVVTSPVGYDVGYKISKGAFLRVHIEGDDCIKSVCIGALHMISG